MGLQKRLMWPTDAPTWLLPWAIWRFRNGAVATRPVGTPKEIPAYAWGFLVWAGWKRKGSPAPRPTSTAKAPIPMKIPQAYWGILKQLNIAVPLAPPPPPPPPPNPVPSNSWKLPNPLVFTSWGWRTDADFRDTTAALQKMAASGVRTVGLQGGYFDAIHAQRCRDFGMQVFVWGEPNTRDAEWLELAEADGYVPQIEGYWQFIAAIVRLQEGVGKGLSISTVTTLAGFDTYTSRPNGTTSGEQTTVQYEELAQAGCTHGWLEIYTGDMQPLSVDGMAFNAKQRGFYYSNPLIGLARSTVTFGTYRATGLDHYGRQVGTYLAETMSPQDWVALGAV